MTEILKLQSKEESSEETEKTHDLPGFCSQASNACTNDF